MQVLAKGCVHVQGRLRVLHVRLMLMQVGAIRVPLLQMRGGGVGLRPGAVRARGDRVAGLRLIGATQNPSLPRV